MKIMIIGANSTLSKEFRELISKSGYSLIIAGRTGSDIIFDASCPDNILLKKIIDQDCDVYLICLGILYDKNILEQEISEINNSFHVNLITIVRICEGIFNTKKKSKIFIIGSESGKKGSFDTSYFLSKAALRAYVRERSITNRDQQIILFSPSTIKDANMTLRRKDYDRLKEYEFDHPKGRFVTSHEIASIIMEFVSSKFNYITNTEIEINGGKFARMKY